MQRSIACLALVCLLGRISTASAARPGKFETRACPAYHSALHGGKVQPRQQQQQ
jgi:hypothetical protein